MRALLCLVIIGISLPGGQQTKSGCSATPVDPYSIAFVESALRFFEDTAKRGSFGSEPKQFLYLTPSLPQLGDDVSIAMLKILDPQELAKPDTAYRYLGLVALAFSDRSKVVRETDKEPKVTMFVLNYLQEKEVSEPRLEARIDAVRSCVQKDTCNSLTGVARQ